MAINYTKGGGAQQPPAAGGQPPDGPSMGGSPGRVTLTKNASSVSLTKGGGGGGVLRVNLNWTARPASGGGLFKLSRRSGAIDLDLGCLYEYTDGSKGVVQPLGNTFRDKHSFGPDPIVWLDGDDRSGASFGGENLYVNLQHLPAIRRILIFTYIYEGAPNWAAANGVVTLFPVAGPEVEVRLDEHDNAAPLCAIATLHNAGGELSVHREVRYIRGGQDLLSQTYGWDLQWRPGRK